MGFDSYHNGEYDARVEYGFLPLGQQDQGVKSITKWYTRDELDDALAAWPEKLGHNDAIYAKCKGDGSLNHLVMTDCAGDAEEDAWNTWRDTRDDIKFNPDQCSMAESDAPEDVVVV